MTRTCFWKPPEKLRETHAIRGAMERASYLRYHGDVARASEYVKFARGQLHSLMRIKAGRS